MNRKEIITVAKKMNDSGLLESKIKMVAVKTDDLEEAVSGAITFLSDTKEGKKLLKPEKAALKWNKERAADAGGSEEEEEEEETDASKTGTSDSEEGETDASKTGTSDSEEEEEEEEEEEVEVSENGEMYSAET